MKRKSLFILVFCLVLIKALYLSFPAYAYRKKVNLPTVKEALTLLNMQESLKPTTFTLISNSSPSRSVNFTIHVYPFPCSRKMKCSLSSPLSVQPQTSFKWKSWTTPYHCFVQGDVKVYHPEQGEMLIRVTSESHSSSEKSPICRLFPEKTPPKEWEFE